MSEQDLTREMNRTGAEPLLPIEKKLIGWSIGLSIALLAILAILNRLL
jgi:hypothetical protein